MEIIPFWLWFIAGIGLLILELNTATFFFGTVGFGALIASLVDFLPPQGETYSFIAFILGTGLAAYLAWEFDIYSSAEGGLRTGADRLIDEVGTVEEEVNPTTGDGIVVVNGEKWRAESTTGDPIAKGAKVVVKDIEGTSLVVESTKKDKKNLNTPEEG
ncbi:NfeD family protein [Candidatus Bipolaricaulota bacterium]|nr:NfeD family protein [Candidatus Bipolaricaulota bacterium]MBS3814411.1 NfeD family protein [Candidatus Bipolaricaulota bacterium]MBS3825539.1 NfeD family protein [Candidatus Bipolaricaulota bacterium]